MTTREQLTQDLIAANQRLFLRVKQLNHEFAKAQFDFDGMLGGEISSIARILTSLSCAGAPGSETVTDENQVSGIGSPVAEVDRISPQASNLARP